MAQAGSKPYFISLELPDGGRVRERVSSFAGERRMVEEYEDQYGHGVKVRGRTYARSTKASRKASHEPPPLIGEMGNPPSGFIPCKAVKITRNRGKVEVRIRK